MCNTTKKRATAKPSSATHKLPSNHNTPDSQPAGCPGCAAVRGCTTSCRTRSATASTTSNIPTSTGKPVHGELKVMSRPTIASATRRTSQFPTGTPAVYRASSTARHALARGPCPPMPPWAARRSQAASPAYAALAAR